MTSNLDILTRINLDDLVSSFGWQRQAFLMRLARRVFHTPARSFAELMLKFDSAIPESGLVHAAKMIQPNFVREITVFGLERIPNSGFLALSNHPGMSDTLSLFCALNRPDLKIIALDRPFLKALPNMSRQLFYLKEAFASRINMVKQVASHLRSGGAVLTFPAGQIEPDPDLYKGAIQSLQTWTKSAAVFVRMSSETPILPILVRGVIWKKTANHLLLGIKKKKEDKEKMAAALQLLAHIVFKKHELKVRIHIGRPIYAKILGTNDHILLHQAVFAEMKHLLEDPPTDAGVCVYTGP